jgi:hypothetical protein
VAATATKANAANDPVNEPVTSAFDPTVKQTLTLTTTALIVAYKAYLPSIIR